MKYQHRAYAASHDTPLADAAEVAAARLKVATSRRLGRPVPYWVIRLAAEEKSPPSTLEHPVTVTAADIAAARLKVVTSARLRKPPPEWVERMAEAAPGDVLTP